MEVTLVLVVVVIIGLIVLRSYLKKQKAIKEAANRYIDWLNRMLNEVAKAGDEKTAQARRTIASFFFSQIEEPYYLSKVDSKIKDGVAGIIASQPHPSNSDFMSAIDKVAGQETSLETALKKTNVDIDEVTEIQPTQISGFKIGNQTYTDPFGTTSSYVCINNSTLYADEYQSTWLLLTNDQVVIFAVTVNLITGKITRRADEFFYKDVTSMSVFEETSTYKLRGNENEAESEMFRIVVPGDKFLVAADVTDDFDTKVQALKSKLREKKSS